MKMDELIQISNAIKERNQITNKIANTINRPALIGHIGEYLASKIFNITLESSASRKSIDGYFNDGVLSEKSVNIKWYSTRQNLLDMTRNELPDFYLVMTGPKSKAITSKGMSLPWTIESVFLFDAKNLFQSINDKVKIGYATSVRNIYWDESEIYPVNRNKILELSRLQKKQLSLFHFK